MKVSELMTPDLVVCDPDTNLAEAAKLMWDRDCGILPIVDQMGHVAGLITDRDVCMAVATKGRLASRISVTEVASGRVVGVSPDADIARALNMLFDGSATRTPVKHAPRQASSPRRSSRRTRRSASPAPPPVSTTCHESSCGAFRSCRSTTAAVASDASRLRADTRARSTSAGASSHTPVNGAPDWRATCSMASRAAVSANTASAITE